MRDPDDRKRGENSIATETNEKTFFAAFTIPSRITLLRRMPLRRPGCLPRPAPLPPRLRNGGGGRSGGY